MAGPDGGGGQTGFRPNVGGGRIAKLDNNIGHLVDLQIKRYEFFGPFCKMLPTWHQSTRHAGRSNLGRS
jgi:hypothetical protein